MPHRMTQFLVFVAAMALLLAGCQAVPPPPPVAGASSPGAAGEATAQGSSQGSTGIVAFVSPAPIVPDGTVAGAPTDIVITFDASLAPDAPGRTLLAGKTIKITFPEAFANSGAPVDTVFTPGCSELCSTGILLQGWPQHPIFPMFPPGSGPAEFYTVSQEGTHTLVFTALQDVTPGMMLPGPGIKQIHLMALGFTNPPAGRYDIQVVAETGPDGAPETGVAQVEIIPETQPTISVTSVFTDGNPNRIYQETSVGDVTPLPYEFLLWDGNGDPMTGVSVEMVGASRAVLKRGGEVVGAVTITAPDGATGQEVTVDAPSAEIKAPISGAPTARLTARFRAGSAPGAYTVTFALDGGNAVTMHVTAR